MSPRTMKPLILSTIILTAAAHAGRTSADYAITAETLDFGGQRTSSADYTIDGSIGAIVGVSSEETTATLAKHGYIGQLYDVVGYSGLIASNYYPDELGTTQLFMVRNVDDGTTVVAPPVGFTLSVIEGPLAGISGTGLVTTAAVFESSAALVGATSDLTGTLTLPLFVQDTIPDNFGTYAGDGIGDDWQFEHFGIDNPLAAPTLDPDGDGQTNLFEFTAGLVPTDPASRFTLRLEKVNGQPTQTNAIFSPLVAGRTYSLEYRTSLTADTWQPLIDTVESDAGSERTITDPAAAGPTKFYRVRVNKR